MARTRLPLLALATVLVTGALQAAEPPAVERFLLPNGLTVLVERDPRLPLVSVTCLYRVGSAHERPGITGIAHYVEHMNFRATKNFSKADVTGVIERIGGRWNGYTSLEQTLYGATVPTWALDTVLQLEADRMARAVFDPDEFQRERTSVIAELQGYENDPLSILWDQAVATSFEIHPYRYNIIGWLTDVATVERDTAYRFYRDFYGPNNAVLAIVGDVDPARVRVRVESHFGSLPPAAASTAVRAVEPPQRGEKRTTVVHPGSQPHLLLLFRAPEAIHADYPALLVLDAVLAGGRDLVSLPGPSAAAPASRLQQVVAAAGGSEAATALTPTRAPYVFGIAAVSSDPAGLERLEVALVEELRRLETEGVSADELSQAKARLRAAAAFEDTRLSDRSHRLAYFEAMDSWELADRILAAVDHVAADNLRSFVRRWLASHQRTVGRHLPGEPPAVASVPTFSRPAPASPVAPSPVPAAALSVVPTPRIETLRRVLPNGAVVRAVRREGPTAALHVRLGFGSADDPPGREGLAVLAARLLTGNPELHQWLLRSGAGLETDSEFAAAFAQRDFIDISLRFLPGQSDAVEQLARALAVESFSTEEVERARRRLLEELQALQDDAAWAAQASVAQRGLPGWRPPFGTPASVGRISVEEINNFLRRHRRGGSVWVTLVAPGEPAPALESLAAAFASLPAGKTPAVEESTGPPGAGEERVPLPGKTRAEIVAALPGVARAHTDFLPLSLLNYILGETGYAGRLGKALVDPGLAYSASAALQGSLRPGPVLIDTGAAPVDLEATLVALRGVLTALSEHGVEEWELREAQAFRLGRLTFELESDTAMARAFVEQDFFGDNRLDFAARSRAILALTRERLNQIARRYYRPELLAVGVAGALPEAPAESGPRP